MSGHSKFANIKHKKEKNDAKKGKIFTIIGREIAVAVKDGGPDPENNSKLRDVIAKAKANNMPNDTIDRGIKKAAGDGDGVNYEEVTYEGYGPSGIAIIVKALTDNKNRTASNVRNAFTKGSGSVGTQGCVSYMFDEKGQIIISKEELEDNELNLFEENNLRFFHLFGDRVDRLQNIVQSLRDSSTQLLDLQKSQMDIKKNRIATVLTIFSTMFFPLSLITGWYGMNFKNMPELDHPMAYPIIIVVSLCIIAANLIYMKIKKWL